MLVHPKALNRLPTIVSFANPLQYTEGCGFAGTTGKVFLEVQTITVATSPR